MNGISGWHYYNHALLPDCPPEVQADARDIESGEIWKHAPGSAILARWTSDFDCDYETQWWYVIKDAPFAVDALKAKRRYEINRGSKFFDVKMIDPRDYLDELYTVQLDAYSVYPEKYRPRIERESWIKTVEEQWRDDFNFVFGAFSRENGELCGYARLTRQGRAVHFVGQKTKPCCEKQSINAALVAKVLEYFDKDLGRGSYICDGARNIQHETAFQDYLEKYFGFRKAYCRLHVAYNPRYKWSIGILYRMRKILGKLDSIGVVHKINGVLKMEEIVRQQAKE